MKYVVLSNRILDINKDNKLLCSRDEALARYNELMAKMKQNSKKEIYYKVENIRILKEIKDNEYYKLEGHKSFDKFIESYRMAKTQVYAYLRLANAMEKGILAEQYIIEHGINESLALIKERKLLKLKRSTQDLVKPLRFQLETYESYDFYKKNSKFISFLLEKLFADDKTYLDKLFQEYSYFKLKKKLSKRKDDLHNTNECLEKF
ncbi:chromosome replication/partitioning protein [Borrelia persica]|uniref:chromosome replication/partitioning protein n=1 Tax=Borrelia persica TaxID=44448 RepID=UPI0004634CF4|nr:chromosome replication/partitioning protein [Borrelia persica]